MALCFALRHIVVVATKAGCWNAFEHRSSMAGFTRYLGMRSLKFKIRKLVVKIQINFD